MTIKSISYKLNGADMKHNEVTCLRAVKEYWKAGTAITDVVVKFNIDNRGVELRDYAEGILRTMGFNAFSSDVSSAITTASTRTLTLTFEDGIHYEEFYGIISIMRYLCPTEAFYMLDRINRINTFGYGVWESYYLSLFLAQMDSKEIIYRPQVGDHIFGYPMPGALNTLKTWRERLTDNTRLSSLKISIGEISINKFFMGPDIKDIRYSPAYTNIVNYLYRNDHGSIMHLLVRAQITQNKEGQYEFKHKDHY